MNSLKNAITIQGWEFIYSKIFKLNLKNSIFFNEDSLLLPLNISLKSIDIPNTIINPKSLIEQAYTGIDNNNIIGIKLLYSAFIINGNNKLKDFFIQTNSNNLITYLKDSLDLFISDQSVNNLENIEIEYSIQIPQYIVDKQFFMDNLFTNINKTNSISIYLGNGEYVQGSQNMNQPKLQIPINVDNFIINNDGSLTINVLATNPNTNIEYSEFGIGYSIQLQPEEIIENYNNKIKQIYYRPFPNKQKFSNNINFDFMIKIISNENIVFKGNYDLIQNNTIEFDKKLNRQLEFDIQPNEIGEFSYTNSNIYG